MERYEVNGWFASFTVDDYERGELDEEYTASGGEHWHADNLPALMEQLLSFAGTDDRYAAAIFDDGDEQGRIDIQTLEDEDHSTPTAGELEAWKRGEKKLWAGYYTFVVERVKRERLTVDELQSLLPDFETV